MVSEGDEVTAKCVAPEETGSIIFYFYEDNKEILEERVNSNHAEAKLRFSSTGIHKIHCDYTVLITPDSFKSKDSNYVTVSVNGQLHLEISVMFNAPYLKQGIFWGHFYLFVHIILSLQKFLSHQ